ncbi:probable protein phosphatase DDB_G0279461 [Fagus crenata]
MATLQKFKLLATQCAVVAGSPTRSPSASPVIHLRRRKTLRMLLNRTDRSGGRFSRRDDSPAKMESDPNPTPKNKNNSKSNNNKEVRVRHKLKDLFVSSPPIEDRVSDSRFNNNQQQRQEEEDEVRLIPATRSVGNGGGSGGNGLPARRVGGTGSFRPITASFRYRLLRRAWRPVLLTIPE